jgi:hypothetical protein
MPVQSRLLPIHPSTLLCVITAGGFLYVCYETFTQHTIRLQPRDLNQRRFLTFKSNNSSCPSIPPVGTKQDFSFEGLYEYLQDIVAHCPLNDTRLVYQDGEYFLTLAAALRWTGEKWNTWDPYPPNDILKRLLNWKLPLLNLLANFGRQPLGAITEISTIAHLVGDPIDTISSMFY